MLSGCIPMCLRMMTIQMFQCGLPLLHLLFRPPSNTLLKLSPRESHVGPVYVAPPLTRRGPLCMGGGHVWIVGLRSFMMLRRPFNSLQSMVFGFTCPMVVHQPHTLSPEFLFALPVDEHQ